MSERRPVAPASLSPWNDPKISAVDPSELIDALMQGMSLQEAGRRFKLNVYRVNLIVALNAKDPELVWTSSGASEAYAAKKMREFQVDRIVEMRTRSGNSKPSPSNDEGRSERSPLDGDFEFKVVKEVDPAVVVESLTSGVRSQVVARRFMLSARQVDQIVVDNSDDPVAVWVASGCPEELAKAKKAKLDSRRAKTTEDVREMRQEVMKHVRDNPHLTDLTMVSQSMGVSLDKLHRTGVAYALTGMLLGRQRRHPSSNEYVPLQALRPKPNAPRAPRDLEIIETLTSGVSVKEVADRLGITQNSVYGVINRSKNPEALRRDSAAGSRRTARNLLIGYLKTTSEEPNLTGFEIYLKTIPHAPSFAWVKRHMGKWQYAVIEEMAMLSADVTADDAEINE